MNNEEGLKLVVGDVVWTTGLFEDIHTPFLVSIAPWEMVLAGYNKTDEKNVFVKITPVGRKHHSVKAERMNVFFLSREHPLGWIFLIPGNSDYDIFMKAKEQNK